MKRAINIVFFAAVLTCAALLYRRQTAQETKPAAEPAAASPQPAQPAPHLALPPPVHDAGSDTALRLAGEHSLMQRIRATVKSDPATAEALARQARQRFGDSADSDERDALLVDALINQQRIGRARDETYYYFDHHPGGRFAEHLFIMTGVHPRPAGLGR
jgi:hypothetical protein